MVRAIIPTVRCAIARGLATASCVLSLSSPAACAEAPVTGFDPLVIELDGFKLRWLYGQVSPEATLTARVDVEFDEPWDLCPRESVSYRAHIIQRIPVDMPGQELFSPSFESALWSQRLGKGLRQLTLSGPIEGAYPVGVPLEITIVRCQSDLDIQLFPAPAPELVPIWPTNFEPVFD